MKAFYTGTVQQLKDAYRCFSRIGLQKRVDHSDVKYIRYTNITVALTAMGFWFYVVCSLCQGSYWLASIQATESIFVLMVLWINHQGHNKVARFYYLLLVNFAILFNSCYIGHQSGVHDFFYLAYMMPFLYFGIKDYKYIIAGILLAVTGYVVYQYIYPLFIAYNLSPVVQRFIFDVNVWMKFVLFGISIYIIAYYNFSSEREVAMSLAKLQFTDELKRSNEELEQFAYIISHDLKSPVRNMASFMHLLLKRSKDTLDPQSLEYVELAKTGAERMMRQIDDVLSYSRVGHNLSHTSTVDLNEVIGKIQKEVQNKTNGLNGKIVAPKRLPVLKQAHANMMYHLFRNLVNNGLKFNNHPEPQVAINYTRENGTLKFSVTDNGIGIPPGYEQKIFQMFQRLHGMNEFEGTGIGLTICKKIASFYKGDIWFESMPGAGTTFYFTINASENMPPLSL